MAAWKRYIGALTLVFLLLGICGIGVAQESDSINFGSIPVGQTRTATYTFKILETSETSATVTILPPGPPFGLQDAPSSSFTLAPGQSITFGVTFSPTAPGDYTGVFTITAQGGYPVQEKTTTVYLTGHGGSGGEAPPPGETPPTPGITIPFPLVPPTPQVPEGAVPGTTDEEGKFTVSLSPTTTVAGRLTLCDNGQPLVNQPFQLAKTDEGFSLFASGYEEQTVTQFSRFSIMGLESYDLGDVCLVPAAEATPMSPTTGEAEAPVAKATCEIEYEWLRKTPIEIVDPLDYFPKQTIMPLGGIIAFHIRASDKDVLKQTCYDCVEGEAVKRIGPVADVVSNSWSLLSLTPHSPDPAGEIIGWYAGNYGDILYQLPEELPEGMLVMDYLNCSIDDLEGPLAKADDEPLYASAYINIIGQRGNTCQVTITLVQPDVPTYDADVTAKAAEDCNPAKEVWEEGRKLILSPYVPKCMCASQLYRLHVHPDDIDIDNLKLRCDAVTCESSQTTIRVGDPTTPIWSDNGAGGTFPFGNAGWGVIYQAPSDGKEIRITCRIDDSGTQYDDPQLEKDGKCIAVKIVRVLAGDPTTHEIPSVLPAIDLPKQHFVTVRQTTRGQDKMKLEAQIQPNTDAAKRYITWDGAEVDATNPLVGLVPRTAALRRPVQIKVLGRTCKSLMAWVIWCSLSSPEKSRRKNSGYELTKTNNIEIWRAWCQIQWIARISPIEIITDFDHPNLQGKNVTYPHPAGSTNSQGHSLDDGVEAKWDMSRQVRVRVYFGNPLKGNPLKLDAAPMPIDNNPAYPASEVTGNDDTKTHAHAGVLDNNPYDPALGQLTSWDRPTRFLKAFVGTFGDRYVWKLQFREFVRVELDGHWYRCSDWGLWRFHIAAIYGQTASGTIAWGLDNPPGLVLELNNNNW